MELELQVKRAQKGDEEAFIELIERHKKLMYVVAKSLINNDEDIADMIQDTILKAFENIKKLKDTASFKNWLIRILVNRCNDFLKSRHNVVELDEVKEYKMISKQ